MSICTDDMETRTEAWFRFLTDQGEVNYGGHDRRGPFRFFEDHKWLHALHNDSHFVSSEAYGVDRPPSAFLIGPDRRLRSVQIPVNQFSDAVAETLKKSP